MLVYGIIAAIIIFIASFETVSNGYFSKTVFNWAGLASAIEVLFGSIFIYIFGKTVAAIANYAEAIYKNQNPNYNYYSVISNGAEFLPGDIAVWKNEDGEEMKVNVKEIKTFEGRVTHYICLLPNGKTELVRSYELMSEDQNEESTYIFV